MRDCELIVFITIVIIQGCCSQSPVHIIQYFGYTPETHKIKTEDGYILTLHRLPYGLDKVQKNSTRPPVLIMHGLGSSSADFVNMGPERSLGYILADLGYDVWLGNARGNKYSDGHENVEMYTDLKKYYDFSWHEMGIYDLPAIINYIIKITKQKKMYYICHSQGCTSLLVMASMKPEYMNNIRHASLMGPAIMMRNIPEGSFYRILARNLSFFQFLANSLRIYHAPSSVIRLLGNNLCGRPEFANLCYEFTFAFFGYRDYDQIDKASLKYIVMNSPSEFALKQAYHFSQNINFDSFRQYDYGRKENLRRYGSILPPEYNISKVTIPIALYYGKNDRLIGVKDIQRVYRELPNVTKDHLIPYEKFNHLDFLFAKDIVKLLYTDLMNEMKKY